MSDRIELLSQIRAAISYAPLGVRDSAGAALNELLGMTTELPSFTTTQLSMQGELNELRAYAHDATYALRGIAGQKKLVCPTMEKEAQAFLSMHGRVANRVMPVLVRFVPDSFGEER
jgi:hypothetical protein